MISKLSSIVATEWNGRVVLVIPFFFVLTSDVLRNVRVNIWWRQ